MSAQHTPGPWLLDDTIDVDLPNHIGISAEENGLLAQVVWKMEDDARSPECEANARLIASAPALREALKRLSFAAMCRDNTMGDPCRLIEVKAELMAANKHACAVIAKVTEEIK